MNRGLDKKGYIKTEVSLRKISKTNLKIIKEINKELLQTFPKVIDSVYVYGSVATGKSKTKKSDLDILVVLKEKLSLRNKKTLKLVQNNMSKKYEEDFREVGLESVDIGFIMDKKQRFGYPCFIKHLCVCIYGKNISNKFPKFKPSLEVAQEFNGDIRGQIKIAKNKFNKPMDACELELAKKSLMKKIIRTAFNLVMPRDNSWTTDLQKMTKTFVKYYPEKKDDIFLALDWVKNSVSTKQRLFKFLNTFGAWLIQEFKLKITDELK